MRYGRHMTRLPALNTHSPQKWAAVVSGTVWKRWGLSPSGTLEAETVRGPLIVWASPKPGEKEDAPALEAPKPTPLDLRVWAVNTAAHFEKFRKAARGHVAPSGRWRLSLVYRLMGCSRVDWELSEAERRLWFTRRFKRGRASILKTHMREATRYHSKARVYGYPLQSHPHIFWKKIKRRNFLEGIRRRELYKSAEAFFMRAVLVSEDDAARRKRWKLWRSETRPPRIIHTRPRPPSAPLAPPVA